MKKVILNNDVFSAITDDFIKSLIKIKKPVIYAESQIDSSWDPLLLKLLGEISVGYTNVTVYDNASHYSPTIHTSPFLSNLYYVPSLLLRNDYGLMPIDYDVVNINGKINIERFVNRYIR